MINIYTTSNYTPSLEPLFAPEIDEKIREKKEFYAYHNFTLVRVLGVGWSDHHSHAVIKPIRFEAGIKQVDLKKEKIYQLNGFVRMVSDEIDRVFNEFCVELEPLNDHRIIVRKHVGDWFVQGWHDCIEAQKNNNPDRLEQILKTIYDFHGLFDECPQEACQLLGIGDVITEEMNKLHDPSN